MNNKTRTRFLDWIRNKAFLKSLNKEELYVFYCNELVPKTRSEKEALTIFIVDNEINVLNTKVNLDKALVYCKNKKKKRAKKGYEGYKKRTTKKERREKQSQRVLKTKQGRINQVLKNHPELNKEEALRKSYLNGLVKKGRKAAIQLEWDLNELSEKDLIKLSGYVKKENYNNLTKEEKEEKRTLWKKANLKNKNIQRALSKEYPGFLTLDIENLKKDEINSWYSTYVSLKTLESIKKSPESRSNYKGCKKGFFYSNKNKKRFWYRSSLEYKTLMFLEENSEIERYLSEPYHIKYKRSGEEFYRGYVPDMVVFYKDIRFLIEVKPKFKVNEFIEIKLNFLKLDCQILIITEEQLINKIKFNEYIRENIVFNKKDS